MDITPFIRELLFGHDCVIVPGLGGFIGNYTPAGIDTKSGTFCPPVKQISFNRNLNHNDGLLVGRISGASGVNYGDARNIIGEFVGEVRRKLERGEKVVFDNIGSFINNQEGNVQFEPDGTANYHLDSYGLEPFQFMPLEYDIRKRVIRHIDKDPLKQASMRKILWRAVIIIPLLSLLVAVPIKTGLFKARIESTSLNPLVTAEFEHNKKAVDESLNIESVKVIEDAKPVTVVQPVPEVVVPVPVETNIYYLITGSFRLKENAQSQLISLKEEGFTPQILSASNGFYRVSAMTCSDWEVAQTKKESLTKNHPGTWISEQR